MSKILWLDSETTGLHPQTNGIIQLAGMVEISGTIMDEFNYSINIFPEDKVNEQALKVNGITLDQINQFPHPNTVYRKFTKLLEKYINRYDKDDKFILAGYNVDFDARMLDGFFNKNGDRYLYSYISGGHLDILPLVRNWTIKNSVKLPNHKLSTVCRHFGVKAEFHNALGDIKATRQVYHIVR